jgi:hypothetical protein
LRFHWATLWLRAFFFGSRYKTREEPIKAFVVDEAFKKFLGADAALPTTWCFIVSGRTASCFINVAQAGSHHLESRRVRMRVGIPS